jgi:hypothetical protein
MFIPTKPHATLSDRTPGILLLIATTLFYHFSIAARQTA